ncbi:hypothetical protein GTZ99_03260 [Novosphingobium sp. FSY-8]|uniref:Lipoprotein n=1 Tax=Novosphingobium ovatum TaxID=1908523 RepID=A0ABW9XAK4_9SPHN|nr:hypothetical protein [Novosphingobium ovatum]NBC35571.1 hypothetical protein [Novosphingobium ovatum]
MLHRLAEYASPGVGMKSALIGLWTSFAAMTGCSWHPDGSRAQVQDQAVAVAPLGTQVDCAVGEAGWAPACHMERAGGVIALTHADGAVVVLRQSGGHWAADGADDGAWSDGIGADGRGVVELAVGGNRYRLPVAEMAAGGGLALR